MNGLVRLAVLLLVVVLSVSCVPAASVPADASKPIEPGDKIGNFTVTKGEGEDIVYRWNGTCTEQTGSQDLVSCEADVGAKANVSIGFYDDTLSGKLDSTWADHTYEMSIDGRPVNLKAFGSIDIPHPRVALLRAWNVVLVADKPGEVKIRSKGVFDGDPFDEILTYTFSAP
jgi:hypothetical protein